MTDVCTPECSPRALQVASSPVESGQAQPSEEQGTRGGHDTTRDTRVWTLPNLLSAARLAGVPLFLWLVLGPEADGWALGLLMVSGVTDFLDGWLARKLDQTSVLGPDPRPGRRPALHPRRGRRARPARHHPVVAGDLAAAARRR